MQDEVGHDNELGAGDGPVEIERDFPAHGVAGDFDNPVGRALTAKPPPSPCSVSRLPSPPPPAPRIDAAGMTVDAVAGVGVAEDALGCDQVGGTVEDVASGHGIRPFVMPSADGVAGGAI